MKSMRCDSEMHVWLRIKLGFLCASILCAVFSSGMGATVEWHTVGDAPGAPLPTSFAIVPANPTTTNTISFLSPANGVEYLNTAEAESVYGVPLISVDSANFTISVTFTPPTDGPVPQIVDFADGVDGQVGPLAPGTWSFQILNHTNTFTVTAAPASGGAGATVEWHTVVYNPPLPRSFVIVPANPTTTNTVSFFSPANGKEYINAAEAESVYGVPLISVDSADFTISVTFTPPTDGPVPQIVVPVKGVDGQFGPLAPGTWSFQILNQTNTFTVTAAPALGIAPAGNGFVLTWPAQLSNKTLQVATDMSSGSWSTVTNGISTNGNSCVFTNAPGGQSAFFRLQ
jgi:hypothetical protein